MSAAKLKANPSMRQAAVARMERFELQRAEAAEKESRRRREVEDMRSSIAETVDLAKARGEQVEESSGRVRIARDGLVWLRDKRQLPQRYFDAGVKFRTQYELANGSGTTSCLSGVRGGSSDASPTDEMMTARNEAETALSALGSPLLHPYVVHVAGEGRMLSDEVFGSDPKRAEQHYIPCVIALDILARHYRMIR